MSLKHFNIFEDEDDDPMLSSINLVDVFLVLVVALLAAVNLSENSAATAEHKTELIIRENGEEIRYQGTGDAAQGEGIRAGVAYRLKDGSIIYVPEKTAGASVKNP